MSRYIWITAIVIVLLVALGLKQAPHEPPVVRPDEPASENVPAAMAEEGAPIVSPGGLISVTRPQQDAKIGSPLLVKGEVSSDDHSFALRLLDDNGAVLVEKKGSYEAAEGESKGTFGELLIFDALKSKTGLLRIVANESLDNEDALEIPVTFE
ncbi:MAG: hypothetical protein COU35_01430 [Candidatus Magasanikbacteria bacterium CG10_big_fil_rev_8_21_14_0_10_47_10]|uniref:Bacterial spore germination immunoglobulin-like domain-containing protein n=1 Tax=Candidatus Magasanikbacteria bacterium CG10_big_fil_rev_8_21_14_0_10_47_10 TaxID=1974652 RepID=A0A2H0TT97_9BACT|nr:MAG: hypothetical protein COU35_01430 [Candidatus Magasanikbacteria bacterium CG10_big_fil_rev_8_21_14_0_10_47_10]